MHNDIDLTRWLYIAGRGHSGSTMLDAMLGNAPDIESIGELVSGMGRDDATCSCGDSFKNCDYWRGVRKRFETASGMTWGEAVNACVDQAHLRRFPRTLFARRRQPWVQKLLRVNTAIANAVGQPKKHLVVDSSKELTRALFLLRFQPDSRAIHLIRHPCNVVESAFRRLEKGEKFKFLRVCFTPGRYGTAPLLCVCTIGWLAGNLLAEIAHLFAKDSFIRVRYEDLLVAPDKELQRIGRFAGVPLDAVCSQIVERKPFAVGHNIGGNQMRMRGSFLLDPGRAQRCALPRLYRIMVHFVCWPLLLAYGYYSPSRAWTSSCAPKEET